MGSPETALPTASVPVLPKAQQSRKLVVLQLLCAFLVGFVMISAMKTEYGFHYGTTNGIDQSSLLIVKESSNMLIIDVVCSLANTNTAEELNKCGRTQAIIKDITVKTQEIRQYPYTIVTAASANHLCSLENFLYSLNEIRSELEPEQFPRIVVYNIGINRTQLPVLDQLQANGLIDDLHMLDFSDYPRFWDIAINAGEYAWKTGIVREAAKEYGGILLWLDAGNLVTPDFLRYAPELVRSKGFWSPRSSFRMNRLTHHGLFEYYGVRANDYARYINCNGAVIGFDTDNSTIVNDIIEEWYQCGLDKLCIAPPGSSRANHRQDQSALTLLAYKNGFQCTLSPRLYYGLEIHKDTSCRSSLLERQINGTLHHPSSLDFPKWQRSDTLMLYNHPDWRYPEDKVPKHLLSLTPRQ